MRSASQLFDVCRDGFAGDEGAAPDSGSDQVTILDEAVQGGPADAAEFVLCVLDWDEFAFMHVSQCTPKNLGDSALHSVLPREVPVRRSAA